ncbi:MAG: DRTGG domain-containing protein, partial [Verrucomicrobiota bacterium]
DTRRILCSLDQLAATLKCDDAEMVNSQMEEELTLMIGAMSAESFESRLSHYDTNKLLLVVGDREDIQEAAIASKVRVLVVTGNLQVSDPIRAKARANGVSIIRSAHDSTTTAMLCGAAIRGGRGGAGGGGGGG